MREYKFRGWHKTAGCMLYDEWPGEMFRFVREGHDVEIMQFTGLKDRNGKDIYEGDIYHQGDKNIRYVVVWADTGLIGKQIGTRSYAGLQHWKDRIEIIGNRFDNPDLLGEVRE